MRETLAKVIAAVLTGGVVLLSAFFADRRNPTSPGAEAPPVAIPASPVPPAPEEAALVARGRAVYEARSCSRCHAIEERGNPRASLDGIGARRTPDELTAGVTGEGATGRQLSRSVRRAKEEFRELPGEELDALVSYLSSIR